MRKTTCFLLAALAFVTIAAVLAITLTAKSAERRQLASTIENTRTENTPTKNTPTKDTPTVINPTENTDKPEEAKELTAVTEEYESITRELLLSDLDIYEVENSTDEVYITTDNNDGFTTNLTPTSTLEETRCSEMTGRLVNGKFVGLEVKYDLEKILEMHGGAPGKVNVTWTTAEDPPLNNTDVEQRPLPDADEEFWIYRYVDTNNKTYYREEHAVRRFSGTTMAFTEIRGNVFFTPDDYCGKSRRASYLVDDRGLTFEVSRDSCSLGHGVVCAAPDSCATDQEGDTCIVAPSHQLLTTTSESWNEGSENRGPHISLTGSNFALNIDIPRLI